jgi:hypothetical protein
VGVSNRWNAQNQPVSFALEEYRAAMKKFDKLLKEQVSQ